VRYANTCFAEFGDRVKKWITFDEPNDYAGLGYATSMNPPGRCTSGIDIYGLCFEGDSGTEPYIVGHNLLLAHAEAVHVYRTIYEVIIRDFDHRFHIYLSIYLSIDIYL
jgi:beta-glucosidase